MRFLISFLRNKSIEEVRYIFSTIPRTENCIVLEGDFRDSGSVVKALAYLPKYISRIVFELQYHYYSESHTVNESSSSPSPFVKSTRTYYTDHKKIGSSLKDCVISLPPSITSISFIYLGGVKDDRLYSNATDSKYFLDMFSHLSPMVNHLDLNQLPYLIGCWPHSISQLLKNISDTVQSLNPGIFYSYKYEHMHRCDDYKNSILSINHNLIELNLSNIDLYKLREDCFKLFFDNLPINLRVLDISFNKLYKKPAHELADFLSFTRNLRKLILRGNQLSALGGNVVAKVLSHLTGGKLTELDIGENGLLSLEIDEFINILYSLDKQITTLRICEKKANEMFMLLSTRLSYIPSHIKILDFSESAMCGLSAKEFVEALAFSPETVKGIDLSRHDFTSAVDDFIYLLSHLPYHFRILKLNECFLGNLMLEDLKLILASVAPWIDELHIVNNGLDRLPYREMREVLTFFPATIKTLVTGSKEFALQNNGAMVSFNNVSEASFFKSQKRFHYQREFAGLQIVMMQLINAKKLNVDVVLHILSHVLNEQLAKLERLRHSIFFISSIPPQQITIQDQEQCKLAITIRMGNLKSDDTCLDLSRCGLNRLDNCEQWFAEKMEETIDETEILVLHNITTINLRGNGFLHGDEKKQVFITLMKLIPKNIKCLDLSDNGFQYKTADELTVLFKCLPKNVESVRLDNESPMSPTLQIARRQWPKSYFDFPRMDGIIELQEAREILNDYTKGDSAFLRFVHGHWNRHCVEDVARLVHYIDTGLMTNMEDLIYELGQIRLTNETGSLARRFSFLTYKQPVGNGVDHVIEEPETFRLNIM